MFLFKNILKLVAWTTLFLLLDACLRVVLLFILGHEFSHTHEYRNLLVLRSIECIALLILTRHAAMSIFGKKSSLPKEILYSFLFFISLVFGFYLFQSILIKLDIHVFSEFFYKHEKEESFPYDLLLISVIVGPFIEEYCFRGLIWSDLASSIKQKSKKYILLLPAALPFVLLHISFTQDFFAQIPLILMWLSCAFITLILFEWRKSILMGTALHSAANFCIYFGFYLF